MMDYKKLLKNCKNHSISVTLKNDDKKGVGLYAKKVINKGDVIAYYKIKIFRKKDYESPTDFVYSFEIYRKNGQEYKRLIGDIYEDSFPNPSEDNITYWAPFANEPSENQRTNSEIHINNEETYSNKTFSSPDETVIYKLVANKMIRPGEEILWYYGDQYKRNYKVGKR